VSIERAGAGAPGVPPFAGAPTYRELLDTGARRLAASRGSARDDPRGEARRLMGAASASADLLVHGDDPAPGHVRTRFLGMVARRAEGVPFQLLAGETGFHDITLTVESGVFLPRPETELLVEEARRSLAESRLRPGSDTLQVLDLCTGSGAVAVALAAAERGRDTSVFAGDVDPHAVRLARSNAARCRVDVDVRRSDLFAAFADLRGSLDLVVSNPPYVAPGELDRLPLEVVEFDPPRALFDPEGGTGFHRRIAQAARDHLRAGGVLLLEIGATQGDEVRSILSATGYSGVRVMRDLAGRDRIIRGTWEGVRWTPSF
jgi:release factor glutamine methyltransferase